jgi:hypothetical protein
MFLLLNVLAAKVQAQGPPAVVLLKGVHQGVGLEHAAPSPEYGSPVSISCNRYFRNLLAEEQAGDRQEDIKNVDI